MKDHYLDKFNLGTSIPHWLPSNTQYLTITGSYSYGMNMSLSDTDVHGFCIPPKDILFPNVAGLIDGFDDIPKFDEWQKHHVIYKDRSYDFKVFSIVKVIRLMTDGNPNTVEMLFTDRDCVLYSTPIAEMVREKRHLFLTKNVVPRFRGYAYQELKNINNLKTGQRRELVEKFGYDCKNAAHVIRLLLECEQILTTGDLNLRLNKEFLKNIREGNWTLKQIQDYFTEKEPYLLKLEQSSSLPNKPDKVKIKQLLIDCLEYQYGSLSNIIYRPTDKYEKAILDIKNIIGGL